MKMSNLCFLSLLERQATARVLPSDMITSSQTPRCEEQSVTNMVKLSSSGIYIEECPVLP